MKRKVRDSQLLDAIEACPRIEFADSIWRVVRSDRDPLRASAPSGRWDDGSFDVLYTSKDQNGAIAEVHYHLSRGQPVFPSQIRYHLHELDLTLSSALELASLSAVEELGVDISRYGSMEYSMRGAEYTRTQEIAEAAHFHGFDGLLVPNARWQCQNVVIFVDRVQPDLLNSIRNHGAVDWQHWKMENGIL